VCHVGTWTPPESSRPIGPYHHIAPVGSFITIGGIAGVDPDTRDLAGADVGAQTRRILLTFRELLAAAGSDLSRIVHINVFLKAMSGFEEMNRAYVEVMGGARPARTVVGIADLPLEAALLTMNLTAVTS